MQIVFSTGITLSAYTKVDLTVRTATRTKFFALVIFLCGVATFSLKVSFFGGAILLPACALTEKNRHLTVPPAPYSIFRTPD